MAKTNRGEWWPTDEEIASAPKIGGTIPVDNPPQYDDGTGTTTPGDPPPLWEATDTGTPPSPEPPTPTPLPGDIWNPTGYGNPSQDPFTFDTRPPYPGQVPDFPWYFGPEDTGATMPTRDPQEGITRLNADGSVTPGTVDPYTRQVQGNELVQNQLSDLLRSDSKFIQDARRQGLEQANALGGLGGTAAIGASMQAAMRSALPIAQSDAEAYRAAAAQNMDALNQFRQLNHQRATQLELGQLDARTRALTTQISASAQMAAAKLESATQRDLSRMDSETRLRLQEMQGQIQDRLATLQFQYTALLNDAQYAAELARTDLQGQYGLAGTQLQGQFNLAGTDLSGQYNLAGTDLQGQWNSYIQDGLNRLNLHNTYVNLVTGVYTGYLDRIAQLNGIEMDDAARARAIESITNGAMANYNLINDLFSVYGFDPILFNFGGSP